LDNFPTYAACSDFWRIHDANGLTPVTVAEGSGATVMHDSRAGLPVALQRVVRPG
jgi:hypothetical protein